MDIGTTKAPRCDKAPLRRGRREKGVVGERYRPAAAAIAAVAGGQAPLEIAAVLAPSHRGGGDHDGSCWCTSSSACALAQRRGDTVEGWKEHRRRSMAPFTLQINFQTQNSKLKTPQNYGDPRRAGRAPSIFSFCSSHVSSQSADTDRWSSSERGSAEVVPRIPRG